MDFIVLTPEETQEVLTRNSGTDYRISPRMVDLETHPEFGNYVAPARVATGPYAEYWAEFLSGFRHIQDAPDNLFLPPEF